MDEHAWWPTGVAQLSIEEAYEDGELRTLFGRTNVWDYRPYLTASTWRNPPGTGIVWGEWVSEISTVEVLFLDERGIVLLLNNFFQVDIQPFAVGDDVSRLSRYEPWRKALNNQPLHLPIGGWNVDGNDRILIYHYHPIISAINNQDQVMEMVRGLGALHSSLATFETPNTERRWNDRLKSIEDVLKTKTMWRAPHSSSTVGLPRLHLSLDRVVEIDGVKRFVPLSRPLAEHLLCQSDRLPSLASLMLLERQWAVSEVLEEHHRQSLLQAWSDSCPSTWSSPSALSTVRGGAWVWRYHATLLELAQATAFGDENAVTRCKAWLQDVSRLQAHLGTLRMWKSGQWIGVTSLLVAFFSSRMDALSSTQSLLLTVLGGVIIVASNAIYRFKDPKPY